MIYITGDTHGDISCFKNPKLNKLGEKDILIVCGDFGFIWNPHDKNEKKNLEFLKKRKYTICFVDGAHENLEGRQYSQNCRQYLSSYAWGNFHL